MSVYTVCHRDFGYICHSYVLADSLEDVKLLASEKFVNIKSVMQLNK